MPKFRKRPIVIEAIQFNGNFDEIESFVGGDAEFRDGQLLVATLEGPLRAAPGDWIIKGIKGEFYPCKPDIFAETYEPDVTAPTPTPEEEKLFRCSVCEREFDTMPADGMHTVHGRDSYHEVEWDGECGPVYEVTNV